MTISAADPTQLGRLSRNGIPQTWDNSEAWPATINPAVSYHYKTLDLDLTALEAGYVYGQFIQVIIDSASANTFLAGYLNSYDPTSAATMQATWLGDPGTSGLSFGTDPLPFQVQVLAGGHLILVLNETTTNAGLNTPANIIVEAYSDNTFTDLVATVPEPATWASLALGIAAVGALRRRASTPRTTV
jgi:hypothetical protein